MGWCHLAGLSAMTVLTRGREPRGEQWQGRSGSARGWALPRLGMGGWASEIGNCEAVARGSVLAIAAAWSRSSPRVSAAAAAAAAEVVPVVDHPSLHQSCLESLAACRQRSLVTPRRGGRRHRVLVLTLTLARQMNWTMIPRLRPWSPLERRTQSRRPSSRWAVCYASMTVLWSPGVGRRACHRLRTW